MCILVCGNSYSDSQKYATDLAIKMTKEKNRKKRKLDATLRSYYVSAINLKNDRKDNVYNNYCHDFSFPERDNYLMAFSGINNKNTFVLVDLSLLLQINMIKNNSIGIDELNDIKKNLEMLLDLFPDLIIVNDYVFDQKINEQSGSFHNYALRLSELNKYIASKSTKIIEVTYGVGGVYICE